MFLYIFFFKNTVHLIYQCCLMVHFFDSDLFLLILVSLLPDYELPLELIHKNLHVFVQHLSLEQNYKLPFDLNLARFDVFLLVQQFLQLL